MCVRYRRPTYCCDAPACALPPAASHRFPTAARPACTAPTPTRSSVKMRIKTLSTFRHGAAGLMYFVYIEMAITWRFNIHFNVLPLWSLMVYLLMQSDIRWIWRNGLHDDRNNKNGRLGTHWTLYKINGFIFILTMLELVLFLRWLQVLDGN
jgi:hypothetical protein